MRKPICSKNLLILLLSMFASAASAHDIEVKNADGVKIYYSWINNNTELEVSFRGDKYNSFENEYSGNVVIPESVTYNGNTYRVTSISEGALANCGSVTSVTMPNSVNSIGKWAFLGCGMSTITISNNVTVIPQNVFSGCWNLHNIIIPDGVTSIGLEAFSWSMIQSVTLPNSLTYIEYNAFEGCKSLTSVISEIKNPFQIQMKGAFEESSVSTATLTVPAGTKKDYIAAGWHFFKEIIEASGGSSEISKKQTIHVATAGTLPDLISESAREVIEDLTLTGEINGTDLAIIREMAGCPYWTETTVDIEDWYRISGKLTVLDLSGVKIKAGGSSYYEYNGYNYINNNDELPSYAFYRSILTSFIAPSSVKSIGIEAFYGCSSLSNISNLSNVTSVGDWAFSFCKSLPLVAIPNNVKTIGDGAFSYCTGITSVTFSNNVTSIGNSAFYGCSHLSSIHFPNISTSIGSFAFSECTSITTITSDIESLNSFDDDVFSNATYSNATLTVPKGKKATYQSTSGWKNFKNIVEEGGGSDIQKKRTIHVATAGTLSNYISEDEKYQIEELTLTGDLNGDDLGFIREMAGKRRITKSDINYFGDTEGRLMSLDFSGTRLVVGGNSMIVDGIDNYFEYTVTRDNELPPRIFEGCKNLASISIPNSVSSIGSYAFSGTAWYNNQPDGVVYIGKVLYAYKGDMPANTNITIKDGTIGIACSAFEYCSNLVSITIPNSVTTIGGIERYPHVYYRGAFVGCTGLTSVTIPNSVNSLGSNTFYECSSLTSVISEIQNPFEIDENVFYSSDTDIYATATLLVPNGKKLAYQSTGGWKKFAHIIEGTADSDKIEFTVNGITYLGIDTKKRAWVKAVDWSLLGVVIPENVNYNGDNYKVIGLENYNVFDNSNMRALVWDIDEPLLDITFVNMTFGANFLLYVKDASYAPTKMKNVVVDGKASSITLSESGGDFYCPRAFTVENISYTHHYSMTTGGNGKGWETIALPYDVQTITHATQGEIVPFAAYSQNYGKKPFWLCSFGNNGFVRASNIKANTPYIIAMPNQSNYSSSYVLSGDVTFSAENVTVAATPTFSGTFVPTFSTVPKASDVYALNVVNRNVSQTGGYDAGSKFISNLRDVRPFEAYISQASSTRGIYDINMEDGTTSMDGVLTLLDPEREIDIYTLSGQKVKRVKQSDLDDVIDQLPHGVYIVNGQKIIR